MHVLILFSLLSLLSLMGHAATQDLGTTPPQQGRFLPVREGTPEEFTALQAPYQRAVEEVEETDEPPLPDMTFYETLVQQWQWNLQNLPEEYYPKVSEYISEQAHAELTKLIARNPKLMAQNQDPKAASERAETFLNEWIEAFYIGRDLSAPELCPLAVGLCPHILDKFRELHTMTTASIKT